MLEAAQDVLRSPAIVFQLVEVPAAAAQVRGIPVRPARAHELQVRWEKLEALKALWVPDASRSSNPNDEGPGPVTKLPEGGHPIPVMKGRGKSQTCPPTEQLEPESQAGCHRARLVAREPGWELGSQLGWQGTK